MAEEHKPKPIPIRLPKDVENAVREAANLSGRTINAIVTESVMNQVVLPDLTQVYQTPTKKLHELLKTEVAAELEQVLRYAQFLQTTQIALMSEKQLTAGERDTAIVAHNHFHRRLLECYTQTATMLRVTPVKK